MNTKLREDADAIIKASLNEVLPDEAVSRALHNFEPRGGRTILVAAGKAAWQMANAAIRFFEDNDHSDHTVIDSGIVITKYGHVVSEIPGVQCLEAGHPVPDENSFEATSMALDMVCDLTAKDTVIFLLSGGESALFEQPLISADELQNITKQLLSCGADITEINTIRKRLSAVKGGKFAKICEPAHVFSIVLSDIIGDPLDMIASGPAYPDSTTCQDALSIVDKYGIRLSDTTLDMLHIETPKTLNNVTTQVTGSVKELAKAAADKAEELGYESIILTDQLCCEAREAGSFLSSICKTHAHDGRKLAFIAGGETVVHLTGNGKGGRNQEIALSAAIGLQGLPNTAVFSFGSDGTDGPTDAAGGYADADTYATLHDQEINIYDILRNNDAYHALEKTNGLIITGPTGTNVNDVSVALIG